MNNEYQSSNSFVDGDKSKIVNRCSIFDIQNISDAYKDNIQFKQHSLSRFSGLVSLSFKRLSRYLS